MAAYGSFPCAAATGLKANFCMRSLVVLVLVILLSLCLHYLHENRQNSLLRIG